MKLILVRHGHYLGNNPIPQEKLATMTIEDWNQIDLLGLSPQGIEQARCIAAKLRDIPIDYIYASPIPRALETAKIIQEGRNIPLELLEQLKEIPPLTFPGAPADYRCDQEANYRQAQELEAILRRNHGHGEDAVVAVTHGNFMATLLSSLLGLGPCGYNRFTGFANCALVELNLKNPNFAQLIWGK